MADKKYTKPIEQDEIDKKARALRLPFALCKDRGIELPKNATPKDAWNALKGIGMSPEREMEAYFEKLEAKKRQKEKNIAIKTQLKMEEHNPDYNYETKEGFIAGVKQGNPMTFEEANSRNCNPFFNVEKTAMDTKLFGYQTNCQTCVVAYEARLRGYNVRALPKLRNGYMRDLSYSTNLAYKTEDGNPPKYIASQHYKGNAHKFMQINCKENERYTIEFAWGNSQDGHIVSCEKINGQIRVYDPQTGDIYQGGNIDKFFNRTTRHKLLRVDNLQFNSEFVDHILKGR